MELEAKIESLLLDEEFVHFPELVALGSSAVPVLIRWAREDSRSFVRIRALEVLGSIGDRQALPVLEEALRSESSVERLAAAWTVAEVAGAEAVSKLQPLLADPDPSVLKVVVRSLGKVGDATVLSALERVKEAPAFDFLREEAVAAIDTIKDRIA